MKIMKLVFATNNEHKLHEVREILCHKHQILSLSEIGCSEDIPETADTLEGNAALKSRFVFEKYGYNCFADDTGLEVVALGMQPGVFSARYAGEQKDPTDNMNKLLAELDKINKRNARFRTVISLIIDNKETLFEGIVDGEIITEKKGNEGFGYDPIFKPLGYSTTFAQMDLVEKNKISHRGRAVEKLIAYLQKLDV
jgi:XTP/dITP diphosphohydrolase